MACELLEEELAYLLKFEYFLWLNCFVFERFDLISSILFCSISSKIVALSIVLRFLRPLPWIEPLFDIIGLRFMEFLEL